MTIFNRCSTGISVARPKDFDVAKPLTSHTDYSSWRAICLTTFGYLSLLIGGSFAPTDGFGQEATAEAATLDEVIVTARKRDESVLDVPIAITVLTSDAIEQLHIQTFQDFALKVPNLSYSVGGGAGGFFSNNETIRGVSGNNTTAMYIDDTPVPQSINLRVVDLANIEVLKGPQGTLYGQSSMGGNVKLVTQKPSFSGDSGKVSVEGGATSGGDSPEYGVTGVGNFVAIPDRAAFRVMLVYQHDPGFIRDLVPGIPNDPAYTTYVPTAKIAPPGLLVNNLDPTLPRVSVPEGALDTWGGSAIFRIALTSQIEATIGALAQQQRSDGVIGVNASALTGFRPTSFTTVEPESTPEGYNRITWLPYLNLGYSAQDFSITSSTSYFYQYNDSTFDGSLGEYQGISRFYGWSPGQVVDSIPWYSNSGQHQFTEELRLAFTRIPGIKGLSGTVGLFGSWSRTNGCLAGAAGCIPVVNPGQAAQGIFPTDLEWGQNTFGRSASKAIFGELYYSPIPALSFTLGLRRYSLSQTNETVEAFGLDNTSMADCPNVGAIVNEHCVHTPTSETESGIVPKYSIEYKFAPEAQVYASASKGFRPGGAVTPLPAFCIALLESAGDPVPSATGFKSDSLWSYEIGAKGAAFDKRLTVSGAGFDIEWKNKQQSVTIPLCSNIGQTVNLGAARIRGGELEVDARPFLQSPFSIHFGVGYSQSEITQAGPASIAGLAPIGSPLLNTPLLTATTAVNYSFQISSNMEVFTSADYSYTGAKRSTDWSVRLPIVLASYRVLNARLGLRFGNSEVEAYARNLTNTNANLGDYGNGGYIPYDSVNGTLNQESRFLVLPPVSAGLQFRKKF